MKKRIFMLLIAVLMMLGMTQVVFAENTKYYEGVVYWVFPSTAAGQGEGERIYAIASHTGDRFEFSFTDSNGNHVVWRGKNMNRTDMFHVESMDINGDKTNTGAAVYVDSDLKVASINSRGFSIEDEPFRFDAEFLLKESKESQVYQIAVPFTGTADSDRGDYSLAIAGQYTAELADGIHVLTADDITAQTIAVAARNKANGVKRVMRENTVEEMTVTVSGGEVTAYIIRGRVQTDGGTLDRYTAAIKP